MMKMAKKKKRKKRLKTGFKRFLVYLAVILLLVVYGTVEGHKIYQNYLYQQTYEYKINQIGYPMKETKKIISTLPDETLERILKENEYNENYYKIITQKYFLSKNFDKYYEYLTNDENDTSLETIIAIVNVHAEDGWYMHPQETNIKDNYLMIVNKTYHLNKDFKRDDLEKVSLDYAYSGQSAAKIVIENFLNMRNDIKDELGVRLMVNSSYRSYADQEKIYDGFKSVSLEYADSYAARPGYSEHQTGLAIDITSLENPYVNSFKKSKEYDWLKKNCYKYGFILRYPEGKEMITGYNTESWHFRYVGKEVAEKIQKENITFDEYYAYYIEGNK